MKISIESNDSSNSRGNNIYCNGKMLSNKDGGIHANDFSEDEIETLLGNKKFAQYQKGTRILPGAAQ